VGCRPVLSRGSPLRRAPQQRFETAAGWVTVEAVDGGASPRIGPGPPSLLSVLSVFLWKSVLYGASVWARRALNSQKRWFPARAVHVEPAREPAPPARTEPEPEPEVLPETEPEPELQVSPEPELELHVLPEPVLRLEPLVDVPAEAEPETAASAEPDAAKSPSPERVCCLVDENMHRYPMSLTSLECQASELVNSDTCPRPRPGVSWGVGARHY
jgi:hypothetical protein